MSLPRKLGQHFLVRDSVLERLAAAACGNGTPRVIEIGPGRGALTRHLLPRTEELHAVELDPALVDFLQNKFSAESKLHVHHGDVLTTDLSQWGPGVITGNLPYYITSPIIERFLALDDRFPLGVFLMQWEVAERISAKPGTRDYGYLTVATQLVCDVQLICKVPPSAFAPPPKVDSGALQFCRKTQTVPNLRDLLIFVSRCFTHKRKTLRNNLKPFRYGIDSYPEANLRAEQLSIEQFISLHAKLSAVTSRQSRDTGL
ncbi:MAG: ribosomal RNA small subunit methyltransferase A [Acidobacteriaceae bacterium]|nr:ribosomal RNA small subunit methyltransferase A [Acidobacteriaceae bacterium]